MMQMRPHILAGVTASVAAYNAVSEKKIRVEDAPYVGPRVPALKTIDIGSEYPVNSRQTVSQFDLINGTFVGMHHYGPNGACDSVHVRDVEFITHKKWATRSYRMRSSNRIEYTSIREVKDEHGVYWNLAGGVVKGEPALTISHCYFENIGSQGIQLVQRDHEQGFDFTADSKPAAPIFIADSLLRNIGSGWGDLNRASFAISAFGREIQNGTGTETLDVVSIEQHLYVRRVMLDNSMQTAPLGKDGATSHGALYVGPRPKAVINEFVALMGVTDRPVARFEGVEDVTLEGCLLHATGGQAWIEFQNCKRINVKNCRGNVKINVRTGTGSFTVGMIGEGYSQV